MTAGCTLTDVFACHCSVRLCWNGAFFVRGWLTIRRTFRAFCTEQGKTALLAQWDIERNLPLTPDDVTFGSHKKVWWTCPSGCLLAGCSSIPAAILAEGEGGTTGFTLELPCNTGRSEASSIKSAFWTDADSSSVCRTSAEESLPGSFRSCPRPAGSRRRAVNRKTHVPLNFINGKS